MRPFTVLFDDPAVLLPFDPPLAFQCLADDSGHAEEQCQNAEPRARVLWTVETESIDAAFADYWGA